MEGAGSSVSDRLVAMITCVCTCLGKGRWGRGRGETTFMYTQLSTSQTNMNAQSMIQLHVWQSSVETDDYSVE